MPPTAETVSRLPLGRWSWGLYAVAGWALFFPAGDVYLRGLGWLPVPATALFALFSLPFAVAALHEGLSARGSSRLLGLLSANAFTLGLLALPVALTFLAALVPGAEVGSKALLRPLSNLAVFTLALVAVLVPAVRDHWRFAVAAGWWVLVATVMVDVVLPGTFTKRATRAAGLPEDPNFAAFLLVLAAALLVASALSRRESVFRLVLTGCAVAVTLSRGGLVLFGLLVLLASFLPPGGRRRDGAWVRVALIGAAVILAVGAVAAVSRSGIGMFELDLTRQRLAGVSGGGAWAPQKEARVDLALYYLDSIAEAPWLGRGAGFVEAQPFGPHNRFLFEWANLGILGLISYAALLAALGWIFWRRRFLPGVYAVVLMVAWSFLHHLVFELRGVVLAIAWSAGLSSPPQGAERSTQGGRIAT